MRFDDSETVLTSRLRLEPLTEAHAEEMVSVLSDRDLYQFTGGTGPTLEELQQRYRHQVAGPADGDEVWRNWILREIESSRAVGFVQATVVGDAADVAWLVGSGYQGRGLASEAALAMCRWLSRGGARWLTAHIHVDHVASQRVASAVGMSRTGDVDEDGEEIWASSTSE